MTARHLRRPVKVRTVFLSDIHLGYKHARVRELSEFLQGIDAEQIVLVGDIIDALSLGQRLFWTAEHTNGVGHCSPSGAPGPGSSTFPATTTQASRCLLKCSTANSKCIASGCTGRRWVS